MKSHLILSTALGALTLLGGTALTSIHVNTDEHLGSIDPDLPKSELKFDNVLDRDEWLKLLTSDKVDKDQDGKLTPGELSHYDELMASADKGIFTQKNVRHTREGYFLARKMLLETQEEPLNSWLNKRKK